MKRGERGKLVCAGMGAFLSVALLGCLLGIGKGKAQPQAPAVQPSVAASVSTPPAPASSASIVQKPQSEPTRPVPTAFTFTGDALLQQVADDLGLEFPYQGSFFDQGVYVTWAAVDTLYTPKASWQHLQISTYAQTEGGPVEAIRLKGHVSAFAHPETQATAKTLIWQACMEDENIGGNAAYVVEGSDADGPTYTLWAKGSKLTQRAVDQVSWASASVLADSSELYRQLQSMNISYRYPELVELLRDALPEEARAQDPFLREALALAQKGALLEAQCVIDSTVPTAPIIYYQGVTEVTEEIHFVPRLANGSIGALAGFYDSNDTPFHTIEIRSGKDYAYDTCKSNDITQISMGRFLKTNGNLLVGDISFRNLPKMEEPVIRFSGENQVKMYDHVFTAQEIAACRTLYELDQLEDYLHKRTWNYHMFT